MVEHIFLGELVSEMWFHRDSVLEVAKAEVDSWGYDVVLSHAGRTRYVQLKTSVPADVSLRLLEKPGACVVAAIPQERLGGLSIQYRFWEPADRSRAARELATARATVYKRGENQRPKREGHRHVNAAAFSKKEGIAPLARKLFP